MTTFGDPHTCGKCKRVMSEKKKAKGKLFPIVVLDTEHQSHLCKACAHHLRVLDMQPRHGLVTRYDRPPQGTMRLEGTGKASTFTTLAVDHRRRPREE